MQKPSNRANRRLAAGITEPVKIKALTGIGSMMETYENITRNHASSNNTPHCIKGCVFDVIEDVNNEYHTDKLAIIKAGSKIKAEFACDSGMYAVTEMTDGTLVKVLIPFTDLHKINFGIFDARNEGFVPVPEVKRPQISESEESY